MARVLVIDGDSAVRALLARSLTDVGHDVEVAAGARAGTALARVFPPDLVLVDLVLPDGDGAEVCIDLRRDARARSTPVLVLTDRRDDEDRVRAFEAGADDVVAKPFSLRELLLRVRALLRRRGPARAAHDIVTVGDIEVDRAARRVRVAGAEVVLTRRELDLLVVLVERTGRVQTREMLVADVWTGEVDGGGDAGRVVDTTIKRLRRKLGPAGAAIVTVRGAGYRLAGPHDAGD